MENPTSNGKISSLNDLNSRVNICRKIELIKFTCRARQLFIRILAVVKWAGNSEKVAVCEVKIRCAIFPSTDDRLIVKGYSKYSRTSCAINPSNIRFISSISS